MNKEIILVNFEEAMENFDFKKVRKVMKLLNWTWASLKEEDTVPTVKEMKITCKHLMDGILSKDEEETCWSTGGFSVCTKKNNYVEIFFTLERSVGFDFDAYYDEPA